jgi:DNA helicase-4
LGEALRLIAGDPSVRGRQSVVKLLGRYQKDRPRELQALKADFPTLSIEFQTVFKAKGLEADHVVVLGLGTGLLGFPSEIEDDPILDLVLPPQEHFRYAEERRVFYVALTRARYSVFLLADEANPSPFVLELLSEPGVGVIGQSPTRAAYCQACTSGRLLRRNGPHGAFLGCSNWPLCKHTQKLPAGTEEMRSADISAHRTQAR